MPSTPVAQINQAYRRPTLPVLSLVFALLPIILTITVVAVLGALFNIGPTNSSDAESSEVLVSVFSLLALLSLTTVIVLPIGGGFLVASLVIGIVAWQKRALYSRRMQWVLYAATALGVIELGALAYVFLLHS